ncbi:MAG: hypothetical protein ACK46Q_17080, partial [Hyphomonas sp.]
VEEVDRENATDARRAADLGLHYRTSPGETQGARATPATRAEPGNGAGNDTDDGAAASDPATEQEQRHGKLVCDPRPGDRCGSGDL